MAVPIGAPTLILLALTACANVAPGGAPIAEPPAIASRQVAGPQTGLICIWAIYATLIEVGKRCGAARNPPVEAELERSVSQMEAYALRQSPAGAASMASYRQNDIAGDAGLCHSDAIGMYAEIARATPEMLRTETERLLAAEPPVEWGTCL